MEPASRLMGKLNFPRDSVSSEALICAAWSAAVGKRIALHARAERVVRTKLIVGVDDAVWRKQLFTMSRLILAKLGDSIGNGLIDELEFRVAPAKRGPQRAAASTDEADRIEDPSLRRIYITSRKRELA